MNIAAIFATQVSLMRDQMNVVGHNDEAASQPTAARRAIEQERNEALIGGFVVQDVRATFHTRRQEIRNVPIAIRPDAMETTKAARGRFVRWRNGDAV